MLRKNICTETCIAICLPVCVSPYECRKMYICGIYVSYVFMYVCKCFHERLIADHINLPVIFLYKYSENGQIRSQDRYFGYTTPALINKLYDIRNNNGYKYGSQGCKSIRN